MESSKSWKYNRKSLYVYFVYVYYYYLYRPHDDYDNFPGMGRRISANARKIDVLESEEEKEELSMTQILILFRFLLPLLVAKKAPPM